MARRVWMKKKWLAYLGTILLTTMLISGNTYYIDYTGGQDANSGTSKSLPWKKCPGMNGFKANYSHQPGDVYILKGGVVWLADALPMAIESSGSVGKPDSYTTDHQWFSGPHWTQPTLDGQLFGKTLLSATGAAYFRINDIRFINAGSLSANSIKGVDISNCTHMEISNNTFALESWGALYIWTTQPKTFNDYLIHHNDISKSAFGIRLVPSGPGSIIQNVQVYNNSLHDFHSQLSGEVHGDGIQHYCSPDNAESKDRYIDGFKIFNNSFTGDFTQVSGSLGAMTALIYLSGSSKGVEIYNNLFAPEYTGKQSPNFFESFISLRDNPNRGGGHKIYNNTFVTAVPDGQSAALLEDDTRFPSPNLDIKNNIFKGFQWPFDLRSLSHTFDNNDLQFTRNVGKWNGQWVATFQDWQKLGNDIHGINADPMLVSSNNFHLLPGSPCVNHGTILGEAYAIDREGILRPQGFSFDMGASESVEQKVSTSVAANPVSQSAEPSGSPLSDKIRLYDVNGRLVNSGKSPVTFQRKYSNPKDLIPVSK